MALTSGQSSADLSNYLPAIPDTLIERSLWLENNKLQRPVMDIFQECQDVFAVAGLLLTLTSKRQITVGPHPRAARALRAHTGGDRPVSRSALPSACLTRPCSPVCCNPATSALGCLIVSDGSFSEVAWDRELTAIGTMKRRRRAPLPTLRPCWAGFFKRASLPPTESSRAVEMDLTRKTNTEVHRRSGSARSPYRARASAPSLVLDQLS